MYLWVIEKPRSYTYSIHTQHYILTLNSSWMVTMLMEPVVHMTHALHTKRTRTTSRMYSYGEYKAEDQEKMLEHLDKKVSDVYNSCIGANEANIP